MAETYASHATRAPLSEASYRINSVYPGHEPQRPKSRYEQSRGPNGYDAHHAQYNYQNGPTGSRIPVPNGRPPVNQQNSAHVLKPPQDANDAKRMSQASYDSTASSRSKRTYKTHIGPWQLGKTLGKGSSARVRLCRHNITNQLAAVKIVNRRMANLVQDSSLAALSKWDNSLPEHIDGEMRVPMAIEREVAILKLIEHPNIMKLYDIWENRSEVYLILEYIDQGDLFTFINTKGRLSEEVSIFFFRQIISAISYCHSFNICHRDLKPENILITADLQIKIADFGMAALHQTATHQLATACGSPHYAAPELLKNRQYRGDRADIWSLGVILYAMLSATLPFDDPNLRVMMSRTKRGLYTIPEFLSPEAKDLIRRMLQVNPDERITLKEIWRHPLVSKYSYLDHLGDGNGQYPDTRKVFQSTPVRPDDVDGQLVRQLRSMWHMFSENELKLMLTCQQPNDQKAFYWLLYNYREKQLEDFKPELAHSMSDYHHLRPGAWKKRISTRDNSYQGQVTHIRSGPVARRGRMTAARTSTTGRLHSSRGSISSLHSTRQATPHTRSLRHKRGVDFSSVRKRSGSLARARSGTVSQRGSTYHIEMDRSPTPEVPSLPSGVLPKPARKPSQKEVQIRKALIDSRQVSEIFGEELRHFSNNIAKDCDEAFRSSLIEEGSIASSLTDGEKKLRDVTPFCLTVEAPDDTLATSNGNSSLASRPLPPLPPHEMDKANGLVPASAGSRPTSRDSQIECQVETARPVVLTKHTERRVVSAPVYAQKNKQVAELNTIQETSSANDKTRIVSAPPHSPAKNKADRDSGMEFLSRVENSIRVVNSPSSQSPVKAPKPLNLRKKTADQQERALDPENMARSVSQDNQTSVKKKKTSWFKRHKPENEMKAETADWQDCSSMVASSEGKDSSTTEVQSRKKTFSFPFWKSNKPSRDSVMSIGKPTESEPEHKSTISSEAQPKSKPTVQSRAVGKLDESMSGGVRNIEVKQSWLARLFRVKPATSHICLVMSRRRARQEVAILLREWRKYGMRGVQVDKQRNIVFARIAAKNFLELKEVSFAAEVITVIEHGKRQPLSIIRFTQERGAASSFHRVVEAIKLVFESRGLLVMDANKEKMMIKTLNS
ncbi:hypothetical protein BGZ63DRAFT_349941 [Mariannaea sp. PMI_226]|nr:hypothetical protein BGZ63DRAFT_349941 [Mariannaea sp. PMI_226]